MTVYVIQESVGRNILPAKDFGDLEVLLPPNSNIVLSPGPTVRRLKSGLAKFSDDDYLLLMGDPAAIGIACAVATRANNGKMSLLKWDRLSAEYFPISINLVKTEDVEEMVETPITSNKGKEVKISIKRSKKGESDGTSIRH